MKQIILIILVMVLSGCSSLKMAYVEYDFTLLTVESNPKANNASTSGDISKYSDDIIESSFFIMSDGIHFKIKNKTQETAKLIWDESIFIESDNSVTKILHYGIKFTDSGAAMPPTVIPKNSQIEEIAMPVNRMSWKPGYYSQYGSSPGYWDNRGIFPYIKLFGGMTGEKIEKSYEDSVDKFLKECRQRVGSKIGLLLPIHIGHRKQEYTFWFEVKNAKLKAD